MNAQATPREQNPGTKKPPPIHWIPALKFLLYSMPAGRKQEMRRGRFIFKKISMPSGAWPGRKFMNLTSTSYIMWLRNWSWKEITNRLPGHTIKNVLSTQTDWDITGTGLFSNSDGYSWTTKCIRRQNMSMTALMRTTRQLLT